MEEKSFVRVVGTLVSALVGGWVFFRFGLPILMPFVLAWGVAKAAQPGVRLMSCLPSWLSASLVVSGLYLLLGASLYTLIMALWAELSQFTQGLPQLLTGLTPLMEGLHDLLNHWADSAPIALQPAIFSAIDSLFASGSLVVTQAYTWLFSLATTTLSGLPGLVLFLLTTVVSTFLMAPQFPQLQKQVGELLPSHLQGHMTTMGQCLRKTLSAWLIAQGKLVSITFLVVTLGLMLLNVPYPLLMGALVAVVDALPLFGSGAILVPWAILALLQRETNLAIGLSIVFAVAYCTRSLMEPRLVGKQMGLHPLLTLIAMYGGFQLFGVVGMILCPFCALLLKQLHTS